jgi:hypothetical protein
MLNYNHLTGLSIGSLGRTTPALFSGSPQTGWGDINGPTEKPMRYNNILKYFKIIIFLINQLDRKQKWGGSTWHHPISATSQKDQSDDLITLKDLGSVVHRPYSRKSSKPHQAQPHQKDQG